MNNDALLDALADRLGLADRSALASLGTPAEILDRYADHARQSPAEVPAAAPADPGLTAEIERVHADVARRYGPDTAQKNARERMGL